MQKKYKFKPINQIIEVEEIPGLPDVFNVTKSNYFMAMGQHIDLKDLVEYFRPADCETKDFVDSITEKKKQ